jgi:uncharacterized RDD family membrane protein YckC
LYNDSLSIDTPENVLLEAELAGFGSRCIAALIDYLILIAILVAFFCLASRSLINLSPRDSSLAIGLFILVQFIIISFYHLIFEFLWNGQTPGKRRLGIRVVQTNGMPISARAILVRNFVRLFDFLPLAYGVGLLVMFATKNTQRLGDLAAGTIVVRERPRLNLETIREDLKVNYQFISRYDLVPPNIQVDTLDTEDRRTVVNYLQRRPQLQNREYVAVLVAKQIAAKMGIPGEVTSLKRAETFLEFVARAFELADAV